MSTMPLFTFDLQDLRHPDWSMDGYGTVIDKKLHPEASIMGFCRSAEDALTSYNNHEHTAVGGVDMEAR